MDRSGASSQAEVQGLLSEFRHLYEERLKKLDESDNGPDAQKTRLNILQSYVNDLTEQNEVLIQTVEELEREANQRVIHVEGKLDRATHTAKDYMTKCKELEKELRSVTLHVNKTEASYHELQRALDQSERSSSLNREESSNLRHDLNILAQVLSKLRMTGKWAVEDVKFRAVDFEQIFGSGSEMASLHSSEELLQQRVDDLRSQLEKSEDMIDRLRAELRATSRDQLAAKEIVHEKDQALSTSQNTLNSSLRREEAACNASTEKDLTLLRVNAELQQANAKIDALNKELLSRDRKISSLQADITELNHDIASKETDNASMLQKIREFQEESRCSNTENFEMAIAPDLENSA
ncbi:hypothetical protein CAPTEDRAFT_199760 [Capitella teleta]|uniref:Uncharacterized protein n=1 Tax=Capitella teleta TaxID=283909 RepID=R7VGF6_CAPTE|nr:hypothetical protein CAPTEDRAFT_199760 [Capitella teleta]|eukprot:ELU17652.1 hypothetical protein CAPTEDRAFT_199760 [Capitella teleta]